MNDKHVLATETRTVQGKQVKQLRRAGKVPIHVFGGGETSLLLSAEKKNLQHLYEKAGESSLVYLQIAGAEVPVLLDEIQHAPIDDAILHVSFKRVDLNKKTEAEIPVELVGESSVPQSVVVLTRDVVEVEALPADLPEKFEIDASKLTEIGQTITLKELSYDKDKITLLAEAEMLDEPLAILQEVKEEVVEETTPEAAAEGEAEAAAAETAESGEAKAKSE